jgi:hypothetical protein
MDVLERVGSSRLMLEGKFPYPSAVDCMRYAIQEMAEYDDARMREDQPDHKRNNERQADARKELGQAGYMILSAMLHYEKTNPQKSVTIKLETGNTVNVWSQVVQFAGSSVFFALDKTPNWAAVDASYAWAYCAALMQLHGWDVDDLICETCEAFEAKHLGVPT